MAEEQGIKSKKSSPDWYAEVILKAGLADYAPVAGCMVVRPYGFAMWEMIKEIFDCWIKKSGHKNAYFPLFIPDRFLRKEAEHFAGFIPEVAFIEKKSEKEEKYALRPTSETVIYDLYSKWIRSWRDLPLLINQWCNIVRWETKATKLFLRTREFLWQEGHTVHETAKQAENEVMYILSLYEKLARDYLAVPVLIGKKTENEKFAGALYTTTLEALMPDGKALQMGTSHNLGQHFSKAFNITFKDREEKDAHPFQTSWGISWRLIGSVIMTHGDEKGLILPPKIAPTQVVIVPIFFEKNKKEVLSEGEKIKKRLEKKFRVELDSRDEYTPGWKYNEWEMKGVPLRIELGPRDIKNNQAIFVKRGNEKKITVKLAALERAVDKALNEVQSTLYKKAEKFLKNNTVKAASYPEFKKAIKNKKMVKAGWCGSDICEEKIQKDTAATIRLLPFKKEKARTCIHCKKRAKEIVYFARAY
jgi:prolyl-tRNA synthetase